MDCFDGFLSFKLAGGNFILIFSFCAKKTRTDSSTLFFHRWNRTSRAPTVHGPQDERSLKGRALVSETINEGYSKCWSWVDSSGQCSGKLTTTNYNVVVNVVVKVGGLRQTKGYQRRLVRSAAFGLRDYRINFGLRPPGAAHQSGSQPPQPLLPSGFGLHVNANHDAE